MTTTTNPNWILSIDMRRPPHDGADPTFIALRDLADWDTDPAPPPSSTASRSPPTRPTASRQVDPGLRGRLDRPGQPARLRRPRLGPRHQHRERRPPQRRHRRRPRMGRRRAGSRTSSSRTCRSGTPSPSPSSRRWPGDRCSAGPAHRRAGPAAHRPRRSRRPHCRARRRRTNRPDRRRIVGALCSEDDRLAAEAVIDLMAALWPTAPNRRTTGGRRRWAGSWRGRSVPTMPRPSRSPSPQRCSA